jgi:molybdate transport system regulatory protein
MSSARRLGLESGQAVLVLMKASMVILALDFEGYALSARNQLAGDIIEIKLGDITADVTLKLEGGDLVTASITRESCQTLGLAVGQSALALFKSGSVVLATRR